MTSPKHTPNIRRQGRDGCGFWDIPGSRISLRIIWICLGYLNESLIVYLADKQVQGERRVTIEERFAAKREKFKDNPEALAGVERRYQLAKRAEALL